MPSTETGHAKNVANMQTLITFVDSLDGSYNPTKASLKIDALKAACASASTSLDTYATLKPAYSAAVDEQQAAFKLLDKLITRVTSAYKASVDDTESIETLMSIKRRMAAGTVKKDPVPQPGTNAAAPIPVHAHRGSHRSYDYRLNALSDIIKILELNPAYQPAEAELQTASLKALHADLLQKTQAVDIADAPAVNARISRNKTLYDNKTGLCDVAAGVKEYVISVYGSGSPQVKYLNQLKFKKLP